MRKFSIILPLYNGLPYLKHCINSIFSQTFTDFDLIILDSGSTDGSLEFVQSIEKPNIIYHTTGRRLLIEENWGRIKDIPKGEFMTIIGQDDILYPEFLAEMNKLILENKNASLWHTHFDYIDAEGKIIKPCFSMPIRMDINELLKLFLNNQIDMMGTGYIMRSADYNRIGGIPVNYPSLLFADFELWFKLTKLSYEVVSVKSRFAFRIHQSTTTTSKNKIYLKAFEIFVDFLCNLKKTDKALKHIIEENTDVFLQKYAQRLSHRLIKTDLDKRQPEDTVHNILKLTKRLAGKLNEENNFNPTKKISVQAALWIDSNLLFRKLFLLYKKIFPKAILR